MTPRSTLFALVLLAGSVLLRADDTAWVGATVYPAPDAAPIRDAVVLTRDGRVAAVGPRAAIKLPTGTEIVDCTGKFITAGFWNSHVHILSPDVLQAREKPAADLDASLEHLFTRWGFTTVFDIASSLENTLALRQRIESGELRGPRVLTTGDPIWTEVPIYVRGYLISNGIAIPPTTTADAATARVRALAEGGVHGIKLFTGSVQARGGVANMSVELARAAADEAHRHKLPVFSHPQNTEGLEAAIAGGVDVLAHTAPLSPPWTPEFAARLKDANIALIPTLTLFLVELGKEGVPPAEIERWLEKAIAQVQALRAAGGEIIFGTDIGYTDHVDTTEEYRLLARTGMDFPAILASLTTVPARRFGFTGRSGQIAAGFDADFVVLDADPSEDVTALARVHATVRAGRTVFEKTP